MIRPRKALLLGLLAIIVASFARPAHATYSIAAIDLESGQTGGVGTSCVGADISVSDIFGAAPGFGVVMAQAALNYDARDRAVELLLLGGDAPDVLAAIVAPDFDLFSTLRQYAVIDARGMAVGFTGSSAMAYAGDVQGRAGEIAYSVQGNILTSAAVIEQAVAALAVPGCDLAATLMLALEAGAMNGEGDSRCTDDGIPSDGGFIRVDLADGEASAPFLELQVDDTAPDDPIAQLRMLFEAWRLTHPCPEPEPNTPLDASMPDAASPSQPDAAIDGQAGSTAPQPIPSGGAGGMGGVAGAPTGATTGGAAGSAGENAPAPITTASEPSCACRIVGSRRSDRAGYLMMIVFVIVVVAGIRSSTI